MLAVILITKRLIKSLFHLHAEALCFMKVAIKRNLYRKDFTITHFYLLLLEKKLRCFCIIVLLHILLLNKTKFGFEFLFNVRVIKPKNEVSFSKVKAKSPTI